MAQPTVHNQQNQLSALDVLAGLARHRRRILMAGLAGGLLAALASVAGHRTYTSTVLLIPSRSSPTGGANLRGLASQLGIGDAALAGGLQTATPSFLAQLATSSTVLSRLLVDTLAIPLADGDGTATTLDLASPPRLLGFGEENPLEKKERAIRTLREWVTVRTDRETGSVRITARTRWPSVSLHIANRLVAELNSLNIELGTSKARLEREFLEARIAEQRADLTNSERRLESFLQGNRDYRNSPTLTFEQDRLARDVSLNQSLLSTLLQSYQDSRIREMQDTPAITVVEPATLPAVGDSKRTVQRGILGAILLGILATIALAAHASLRTAAEHGDDSARRILDLLKGKFNSIDQPN